MISCCVVTMVRMMCFYVCREHTIYVDGVGAICDYASFDFDRYGDDQFGAPKGHVDSGDR